MPAARGQFSNAPAGGRVVLPPSVPDPFEPFNRAMWQFNKGLLTDVIKPTAYGYRFVVRRPIRRGIGNMGTNITYPDRVINNMLQGEWAGARIETERFLCNSTIGLAGFFDVATKWNIGRADADFGQTFGQWGWKPHFFIMLPLFGPSNDRDAVGLAADTACNPLLYIAPYDFDASNPLTYLGPYSYFSYICTYNDLSDSVNETVRFAEAEMDPYEEIEYAWTFARQNRVANFQVTGKQDPSSLESLESVFFTYTNENFPNWGKTRSVLIPSTGRRLPFTFWLQPKPAPVVYIVPGLGSHRMAETSLALAELAYANGFTAVCISSPFHSEFMNDASTAAMPAYLPVDGHDLHVALTAIDRKLTGMYPHRLGQRALMGYSMGAFQSLYVAATAATNNLLKFDRYIAINPPVRLVHGITELDNFYRAPLQWPADERMDKIENTFLKVAALSKVKVLPRAPLPFNAIESKFLIGLTFRFTLRDIIYDSQRRHDQGILREPLWKYRRGPVYSEIMQYSYQDYVAQFAVPYYAKAGLAAPVEATLDRAGDLRTYSAGLADNGEIRVLDNENDFLLAPEDLAWLHATFPPGHLTIFPQGGHLGNLQNANVQKSILAALSGLEP